MSDIFGARVRELDAAAWAVDADIWKVGEDIWTPGTAGDALRYMDDPAKDGDSLDYYADYTSRRGRALQLGHRQPGVLAAVQGRHAPARQDDHRRAGHRRPRRPAASSTRPTRTS